MARNVVITITIDVVVALLASATINARDLGQWDDPANADLKRWYQDLKQPDNPAVSCCGEADSYWADAFEAAAATASFSIRSPAPEPPFLRPSGLAESRASSNLTPYTSTSPFVVGKTRRAYRLATSTPDWASPT